MKKNLTMLLALLLALALTVLNACGKKDGEEDGSDLLDHSAQETFNEDEWDAVDNGGETNAPSSAEEPAEVGTQETRTEQTTGAPETPTAEPNETASTPPTAAPVTEAPTAAPQTPNGNASPYAGYSKADIVNYLSAAVNKTKSFTGSVTVSHQESFTSQVSDVTPGGALTTRAVNFVKDLVLKPTQETYNFSGGTATTKDGETTQLLLPKDKPFSLTADGVAAAAIRQENGLTHVRLVLASETVNSLSDVPKYNAASIGYLNLDGKFKIIQIRELTIHYPGSIIDAYVRPDGYVSSVTYTVKMDAFAKASGMGINGSARFTGDQVESWVINW